MKRGTTLSGAIVAAAGLLLLLPGGAGAQGSPTQHKASVAVDLKGVDGNHVQAGDRVTINANLRPFQKGEKLKVLLLRNGKVVESDPISVHPASGGNVGRVSMRTKPLTEPGRYVARVIHLQNPTLSKAQDSSNVFRLFYPDLSAGDSGRAAATFNDLLHDEGYGSAGGGDTINASTVRAIQAFRTVNGMGRGYKITAGIFKKLAAGKGGFPLKHPDAGKHVEVDISRQAMVLADHGKPQYTYHISSGASATPSPRGEFHFYMKDPGYNSEGMYYSVYFVGGYATHGFDPVPTYPASHGCIRNPIPESQFIYNWIDIGDPIFLYD